MWNKCKVSKLSLKTRTKVAFNMLVSLKNVTKISYKLPCLIGTNGEYVWLENINSAFEKPTK